MPAGASRFDFAFIPAGPFQDTVGLVQLGEQLGYRCAWLPDQQFHRDPFALLAVCAQATREIGLGVGVTSPFTRLPMQIARAAGAVDEIAGGRFRLGLGTANVATVLGPLGIPLNRPVGRLRDSIVITRRLLAGETVDFDGPDDTLRGAKLDFPARADMPIYLGTRGPQTFELVGELADGVLADSLFNAMPFVVERLRQGAARSGRSLDSVDVVAWQLISVTDDVDAAIAAQKPWITRLIKVGPPEMLRRTGMDDAVITAVTEAMDRGDQEAAIRHVTDEAVTTQMMIGKPAQVTAQVARAFEQGATSVCVLMLGSTASMRTNLTRFAREVMPAFR